MKFTDLLYGDIEIPDWLVPFLKIPEFVRLRGVRLSNVDSYEFKDFNGPTRWEHCVGVSHLALTFSRIRQLSRVDTIHLTLAALLHDVATPPFAHTVEYIIEGYDHELESNRILSSSNSNNSNPSTPVFASQLPQFRELCQKVSKHLSLKIDPDLVAQMVTGEGDLGFLINGSIDLDNIDNVIRACLFLGVKVDKQVPYDLLGWLVNFNTAPTDLKNEENESVKKWLGYKNRMYEKFFSSSDEELGRQAFLQHLIRRANKEGLSENSIIWNTDEGLLYAIEKFATKYSGEEVKNIYNLSISLKELVERYRLLETAYKVIEIPVYNSEEFKVLKNPAFASWLEDELTTPTFEPFVIVNAKRFNDQNSLFNKEGGVIQIFKLGGADLKVRRLPKWMQDTFPTDLKLTNSKILTTITKKKVEDSISSKPWLTLTNGRRESIKANLDNVGNWSFRLSKNEGIHSYPATFVHAIPATLITALGLKGERIFDPFGGTGQTATEAIKNGCEVTSTDNSTIATMIASAKMTFLSKAQRGRVMSIDEEEIRSYDANYIPDIPNIDKWHHKRTKLELSTILAFIADENNHAVKQFLKVCFSDILTYCTARKGKEHGYFADNTPLSRGETSPPYENALSQFLNKIRKNVSILERFYSYFERNGQTVEQALALARVAKFDITSAYLEDLGVNHESVAGIITSPPYLCMADYTLGQRLSYYWLFPEELNEDFKSEIGSRRSRMKNGLAIENYFNSMSFFAKNAARVLKRDGFLATIIGAPVATAYSKNKILEKLDDIFVREGFEPFWNTNRSINWHRNHGYARLKEERISVFIKR
jgi:HD superfamily phosphohydrolase